jgi:hypothetical protein
LNLRPDKALPLLPGELPLANGLPEAAVLRGAALARRPDLQALADRIAADQAALALANKTERRRYPRAGPAGLLKRLIRPDAFAKSLPATEHFPDDPLPKAASCRSRRSNLCRASP